MRLHNTAMKRPANTKQKGTRPEYNIKSHDPKFKDHTEYKRPRTVRKIAGQVVLTSKGAKDAMVYLIRVKISTGVFAEYYMAKTYHLEFDVKGSGNIRVYDSPRFPITSKGSIFWESVAKKEMYVKGILTSIEEPNGDDPFDHFDEDVDNTIKTINESDFDSSF